MSGGEPQHDRQAAAAPTSANNPGPRRPSTHRAAQGAASELSLLAPRVEPDTPVGISILMPTYNRRAVLRKTLEAFARSDLSGLTVEIVVIDNNSTENVCDCVTSFSDRLPVVCLKESRPGKNRALNKALKECRLLDLVVFVDDDITPRPDWLQKIAAASARWPDVAVFGARVNVGWPQGSQPAWARAEWIRVFGFAWHDLGEQDRPYENHATPMGPCFWIRRAGFATIPLFDENIGPRPTNRIMGGEVSFLLRLQRQGVAMVYCPSVEVEHRIAAEECSIAALRRRAFRCGRGEVRLFGVHRPHFLAQNRLMWISILLLDACIYSGARLLGSVLHPAEHRRAELALRAMTRLGRVLESIRVGMGKTD